MQTSGKTSQAYWVSRLKKRAGLYGTQMQFKGERHYLTFTQDKHASATKAAKAFSALLADGWPAVLKEYGRVVQANPEAKPEATVGSYIEAASKVAKVSARTLDGYCRSLRMIVSEISEIERSSKRYSAIGAKEWRGKVDQIPLAEITPARVVAWQKSRVVRAGNDARKQGSAKTSANTAMRQALSLFGRKILPLVSETLEIPSPIPFAGVSPYPRQNMRYQSKIAPQIVIQRASEELEREPLKILTLALCAGLRAGEIDGLEWSNVDLERGEIQVQDTESFSVKTQHSIGNVEIDPAFASLLQGWKARAKGKFVVESPRDHRTSWRNNHRAQHHFTALCDWLRDLEIDGEKPLAAENKPIHILRKEAGSIVNQRHGLAATSMFLRHSDIGITARYYVAKKERYTTGFLTEPENVTDFNDDDENTIERRKAEGAGSKTADASA